MCRVGESWRNSVGRRGGRLSTVASTSISWIVSITYDYLLRYESLLLPRFDLFNLMYDFFVLTTSSIPARLGGRSTVHSVKGGMRAAGTGLLVEYILIYMVTTNRPFIFFSCESSTILLTWSSAYSCTVTSTPCRATWSTISCASVASLNSDPITRISLKMA